MSRLEHEVSALRRMVEDLRARVPVRTGRQEAQHTAITIWQPGHGFAVGTPIRHDGSAWVASQSDTLAHAVVAGVVVAVLSPDACILATGGYVAGLAGLTPGQVYYLAAGGGLTAAAPAIAVPVLLAATASGGVLLAAAIPATPTTADFGTLQATLTASGTWSPPAGLHAATLVLVASGGNASSGATSGGGGGGATVLIDIDCAIIASVLFSIGANNCTPFAGAEQITARSGADGFANAGGYGGRVVRPTAVKPGIRRALYLSGTHGETSAPSGNLAPGGVPAWGESSLVTATIAGTALEGYGHGAYGGSGARSAVGGCLLVYHQ